jgi:hypothetical protein
MNEKPNITQKLLNDEPDDNLAQNRSSRGSDDSPKTN